MTIRNANIISCPYCGEKKELMSLGSSNNIGAQYWSDLKTIAPMDPKISPVQKCSNCGKYYLEYKQEPTAGDKESWEMGKISYWEWKEAYMQFCAELGNGISQKDMLNVQGWLLQAYNDYFYRGEGSTPSVEEQEFITIIIKNLIETADWGDTTDALFPEGRISFDPPERETQVWSSRLNPIIKAELYREIGDFQKCADLIKSFNGKSMYIYDAGLCRAIKDQMKKGETAVYMFYDERENKTYINSETNIRCHRCGWLNPIGNQRCIKCGITLQNVQADLQSSVTSQANAPQSYNFKQCPNGHYYSKNLDSCPYCDNMRTLEPDMSPHQNGPQSYNFKQCPNGHYYSKNLECCPYCGSIAPITIIDKEEPLCPPSEYIIDKEGHYFMLNSDGKTASLVCLSKEAWDVYHNYMRFYDWYIEASLDDAQEVERQEAHFDTVRIKSPSAIFKIPSEIIYNNKTYPIVRIKRGAFAFCEINSIIIPDTILYIEQGALFRCDGLKHLIIPNSVDLATHAISQCKDLETITWRGTTYEDDIEELFLFPDHIEKYAIILNYNDNIDPECKEYFPWFYALGGPCMKRQKEPSYIFNILHQLRDEAMYNNDVEKSLWYRIMRLYIDEYTMKIIERNQCYKYGLSELDGLNNDNKHHIFWKLKKAIILQDYGLNWLTPEEQFVTLKQECLRRT